MEITINTLTECSQIGSLIVNDDFENTKNNEECGVFHEATERSETFVLIESLMNTLLYNLSSQEVSNVFLVREN